MGWLVVEDLFTVIALVVLPLLFAREGASRGLGIALLLTGVKVAALVAFTALVGPRVIPRVLDHVARTHSRELFTLTVLVIALGIAVGLALVFDVSMALGAFLAGLVVGRSDYSLRAGRPRRCRFEMPSPCCSSCPLGCSSTFCIDGPSGAGCRDAWRRDDWQAGGGFRHHRLLGYPFVTSLSVAVALAQIGEFSFMLAGVGRDLGLLTADASNVLVAVAILSIVLNPILFRAIKPLDRWTLARPWLRRLLDRSRPSEAEDLATPTVDAAHRAIVVGYGPTGRTVTRLLRENGFEPTVVDLNVNTVRELRDQGMHAIYGDATHRDTLAQAGAAEAANLVLTSAGMADGREVIRNAKELNPGIHVLARAPYLRDVPALRQAGAEAVVSAEGEVGLALTEIILHRLGATPDQIDHERERVRSELQAT